MASDYVPRPLRTDGITLEEALLSLVERLAENAHEVWAQQRLSDGWTHGPQRNDNLRQHPCLIPYEALPESEKLYDRNVVLGTVRAILALGFTIEKKPGEPADED
jgi:hypothetical protein